MNPSIGRIVHYVMPSGAHRPADIVALGVNEPNRLELVVKMTIGEAHAMLNHANSVYTAPCVHKSGVVEDQSGVTPGTWHWPEIV